MITPRRTAKKKRRRSDGPIAEILLRGSGSIDVCEASASRVVEIVDRYTPSGEAQTAGRVAEELHAGAFNKSAAWAGRNDLLARTTASAGDHASPADIEVLRDGVIATQAQVKHLANPSRARQALSSPKYSGMQKLVPTEQVRAESAGDLGDRLRLGTVESDPVSREAARTAAREPARFARNAVLKAEAAAVLKCAVIDAVLATFAAAIENARRTREGHQTVGETIARTARAGACGAAHGGARSVTVLATRRLAIRVVGPIAARSTWPLALGMAGFEVLRDTVKSARGEIAYAEARSAAGGHLARAAGACYGAQAGARLGSLVLPGFGTIAGGVLGGLIGWTMGDRLAPQALGSPPASGTAGTADNAEAIRV